MSDSMHLPTTARAAYIKEFEQDLVLDTSWPVTQPSELKPGECLVKLEYAGVCHSDIHLRDGDWANTREFLVRPRVGGHEGIGRVVAIAGGTVTQVKVGDRVGMKWLADVCMGCEMCRQSYESACYIPIMHGYNLDGTFADYMTTRVNYVTPIPDGIESAAATPILCAGVTIYRALQQTKPKAGKWIAIGGAGGGLGHLGVQYAVTMGLRVIAIDTGAEKRELCMSLGAEVFIDFKESEDIVEEVIKVADGLGPHSAVIAAGHPAPFNQAIMYVRRMGTLVAVGMPDAAAVMNVPINLMIAKSLTILGSAVGNRQDAIEALDIAARGKVKCQYEIRPLEDVNTVMHDLQSGKIAGRIVLKM